jgi:hypothetical protein
MSEIRSNELEFMSRLASWLNEFLQSGSFPFKEVTSNTSIKTGESKTRFPDIQIWLNRERGEGFAGWELKTPITPADDPDLLENAAEKARALKANYFVTWNMRDAVIWRTPHDGEKVSAECRFKTYPCLHRVQRPDDLWVASIKELLKSRARDILHDLSTIHRDGHLHLIDIDTVYFVNRLAEAVNTLKPSFRDALIKEEGENPAFRKGLEIWAVKQGIAAHNKIEAFYDQVTRQKLYRLFAKIIFYLTLTRFNFNIPKLDIRDISYEKLLSRLDEYFEAARNVDYQAVFEEDFIDRAPFPKDGAEALSNFVDDLNRFNFSRMPHDVVGNVFERLIPPEERHTLGQYFTNENLVDLIIAFCVRTKHSTVLDPTCGTGTFLIRAYDRLNNFGLKDHTELLSRIWGIDVAHFPAELACF